MKRLASYLAGMAGIAGMVVAMGVGAGAAGGAEEGKDAAAQREMKKAHRKDDEYNRFYQAGENLKAWNAMNAAIAAYLEGAKKFPDNSGFNMGAGVFLSIRGDYAAAAKALQREWEILGGFEGKEWNQDKYVTAEQLALACEQMFDFERGAEFYRLAGQYKPGDAKAAEGVTRCRENRLEFAELPGWVKKAVLQGGQAGEGVAGGGERSRTVKVDYAATPRTYPGFERCQYRLDAKGGKAHVYVSVPMLYRGTAANRGIVMRRLDQAIEKTRQCYARSGLELHLEYKMVASPRELPQEHGVMIWDHYRPQDMRVGDARNWAILTAREFPLSVEVSASTIAHEVGHMLGLGHPAYYPDEPYTDIMTAGFPWGDVSSKRMFPGDARLILGPLMYPPGERDVLERSAALAGAGKHREAAEALGKARKSCPRDQVLATAWANALFDAGAFGEAAEAYTALLALRAGDCNVMYFRGVSRSRGGEYRRAIEDFSHIVRQHSGGLHAAAYWERAEAHEKLGEKKKAQEDRDKSERSLTAPEREPAEAPAPPASQPASVPASKPASKPASAPGRK